MIKNSSLSLRAPAKINWFLKILGKRGDGYHEIATLMQCIGLYDNLIFEHADTIEVVSNLDIPMEDNLIYKAASLLKRYTSYKHGARITLEKEIPISAGLGGGSSDAAYALLGLNMLWDLRLSKKDLHTIGMEIGSDVPFFLNGPFALVEGRGEKVTPFVINSSIVLLLVKPLISISTAWAYEGFDRFGSSEWTKEPSDIKLFCHALDKRDFVSLRTALNNDLERVVIEKYPVIIEIKEKLLENRAVISAMSGSGPTVFGVFESKEEAAVAAEGMGYNNWCRVVETLITLNF